MIFTHPLIRALGITMLISAGVHLTILYFFAFTTGDFELVNYFTVLGLDLIFPSINASPWSFWLSQVMVLSIYSGALSWSLYKKTD